MKTVLLLLLCLALSSAARGNDAAALFEQANAAYAKGDCGQAVSRYLQIVRQHGVSAPLLANMAGCYAAAGQTGLAVLNYERALRLASGDADLRANLAALRKDAGLQPNEPPLPEQLAVLLEADQWLMLSGAAFVLLAFTVLAAGPAGKKRFPQAIPLSLLLLAAVVLPLPPALLRYQSWQDGVITAESSPLLISPFAEAEAVGSLKAGSVVRPLNKEHGGYAFVRDESGRSGWLPKNSFERIADLPKEHQAGQD